MAVESDEPNRMAPESVARILQSGKQAVIAITGGGSAAIARLLAVPGASRFLLEARVPYCTASLDEFLGAPPEQYCSDRTARAMAMAAFWRARKLTTPGTPPVSENAATCAGSTGTDIPWQLVGLGATASLASDRPKRGRHRLHAAIQTATYTAWASLTLVSGRRTRVEEESLAAELLLAFLCDATMSAFEHPPCDTATESTTLGAATELSRFQSRLPDNETLTFAMTHAARAWPLLLLGQTGRVACKHDAADGPADALALPQAIFSGAFNPLHDGHRAMARFASQHLGRAVDFELSIENVDKPPLDFHEMASRARQFADVGRLWLTRAPTFLAKARLFPGAIFLVGADTVLRIAVAKYYATTAARDAAIDEIRRLGCRFLVFGRVTHGQFQSLADLDLPPQLAAICDPVPESAFRADISSSEIRRQQAERT